MPLRRSRYLPALPLIVGSMTPDIPYYFPGRWGLGLGGYTHTIGGSVLLDIPLGLLVIAATLLLRRPLTALMTERARWVSLRAADAFTSRRSNWLLAVPALLVGVWLHILWDGFTHPGTWLVRRVDALSAPVNWFGGMYTGEVSHVLQYVSSIVGLGVVAYWYVLVAAEAGPEVGAGEDRRVLRRALLLLVVTAAVALGTVQAVRTHQQFPTVYRLIYLLLTRTVAWFVVLYLAVGSLFLLTQRPQPQREPV